MNILICHERLIFRFGADRVLILLGKGLNDLGYNVVLMANRYDPQAVEPFASQVIDCPVESDGLHLNESTRNWLETNWDHLFSQDNRPDIIVVGGWPFISAISFFRKVCPHVLFIDFGVVPDDGYPQEMVTTLDRLRALRRRHLRDASLILPISRFIAESQSSVDSGNTVPIRSILLGADHFEASRWLPAQFKTGCHDRPALDAVRALKLQGKKIVLALGRWEPGCYKNSQAALEVIENLNAAHSDCILVILEQPSDVKIPDRLQNAVLPIGFPDDQELVQTMEEADLGLSLSLWEGFNLPLAEMQWLGRPALVFDVGAHPEVVAHDWYLCRNTAEMITKARALLHRNGPEFLVVAESLERFRTYFRWDRFISEYSKILAGLTGRDDCTTENVETINKDSVPRPGSMPAVPVTVSKNGSLSNSWKRVLYPNCFYEKWQMNDSERLALTGLLARHQPHCSIEVGTYQGGSLSLISQYSKMVFSIDIDPAIASRFNFPNVTFLTGRSHLILPRLLGELDKADIALEFMLIDGDHSRTGVKNDIGSLLTYSPKKPLFVALHDSFNPDCRAGMLEAGWEKSPYCHMVDLDFVPGKLAGRQFWGGLAVAYFLPIARNGELEINRTAEEMFQALTVKQANGRG